MTTIRKNLPHLMRTVEIDPKLDTYNSVIYNYPLAFNLKKRLTSIFETRNPNDWEQYWIQRPDDAPHATVTNRGDQESNDWVQIELPSQMKWEKKGTYLVNRNNETIKRVSKNVIHAGWNIMICWNPVCPPQIKNKNMDDYRLYNSPKIEREDLYIEHFDHVDRHLEWMSSSVEEEDNEIKDKETFDLYIF